MIILGIETSCDETAAAVVQKDGDRITILSNIVASSAALQAKYGGVIPEQAAREQLRSMIPVIEESLQASGYRQQDIDTIAVTYGPGLIGSLLVGVETAKTLAQVWKKPLIPVNHLLGHFYANWIGELVVSSKYQVVREKDGNTLTTSYQLPATPTFPAIGLLVSGGHTDLVLFKSHGKYEYLGGTRDDAAGECFDKCARLLGLPYPGGPSIAKLASQGDALRFNLPRPMINSKDFDFSFSGLKTAVANLLGARGDSEEGVPARSRSERSRARMHDGIPSWQDPEQLANLSASIQQAIVDVLVTKTVQAAQKYKVNQIIVAGGVAANQKLVSDLKLKIVNCKLKISGACDSEIFNLHVPSANLCTDNAAMIAAAAFFNYHPADPFILQANPNLSLANP